ncbi:MAG: ATP-binding protein [Bacteroidota bacterium]
MNTRKYPLALQYGIGIGLVLFVATACFYTADYIGYRIVALILLMTVSLVAMLFEILPVLLTAVLSAVTWNFFFIPPIFTFHISNAEDVLMFLLYFSIALVNAVLTFKIRKEESRARDQEEKENTIRLYNTLLNSLSHELRTPISTILGAVDTLKENNVRLTAVQQSELLTEIDTASIRLNRQVENLLNMSRLESGMLKPKFDWCDLNELIHSVVQKMDTGKYHSIVFDPAETLPLIKTDEGLAEQILHNLLHNAIQYTPHHSIITIAAVHHNETFVLTVSDNGMGFPQTEMAAAFDKFYRLPNSKTGGSGLGLSIVKGFVEALNGTVRLQNNQSGGACFTVEIPVEASYIHNLKNE